MSDCVLYRQMLRIDTVSEDHAVEVESWGDDMHKRLGLLSVSICLSCRLHACTCAYIGSRSW